MIYEINKNGFVKIKNKTYVNDIFYQCLENNYIKIINIEDDYESVAKNMFFNSPDNLVIFLFIKNKKNQNNLNNHDELINLLDKIVPSFQDIIDYHKKDIISSQNSETINKIIELYGYNKNLLSINEFNILNNIYKEKYSKENNKISNYIKNVKESIKKKH